MGIYSYKDFIDIVTSLENKNIISMSRIDDAARRILRVKFTMGLFENPLADLILVDQLGKQVGLSILRTVNIPNVFEFGSKFTLSHTFLSFMRRQAAFIFSFFFFEQKWLQI